MLLLKVTQLLAVLVSLAMVAAVPGSSKKDKELPRNLEEGARCGRGRGWCRADLFCQAQGAIPDTEATCQSESNCCHCYNLSKDAGARPPVRCLDPNQKNMKHIDKCKSTRGNFAPPNCHYAPKQDDGGESSDVVASNSQ